METDYPNMADAPEEVTRQKLTQDLRVLIHDAEALLKAGAAGAGEKAEELKARLQASLVKLRDTCRRLEDKTVAAAKATDKVIRQHPYESIGIAFGIGLLVGVLINRK